MEKKSPNANEIEMLAGFKLGFEKHPEIGIILHIQKGKEVDSAIIEYAEFKQLVSHFKIPVHPPEL